MVQCFDFDDINWLDNVDSTLSESVATIWRVPVTEDITSYLSLLTADEIARIKRYRRPKDRNLRIASRGALKMLLSRFTGIPAQQVVIDHIPGKKPQLQGNTEVKFNVSHSGDWALIAIAKTDVGVDMEATDPNFDVQTVLQTAFNITEVDFINTSASPLQTFYRLWTRKEALLKAVGTGIIDDLNRVPCLDGKHDVNGGLYNVDWHVGSFKVDKTHTASFAGHYKQLNFYNFNL